MMPLTILFFWPRYSTTPAMRRKLCSISVPTRTLRRIPGEALQMQDNLIRLNLCVNPSQLVKPLVTSTNRGSTPTFLWENP